MLKKYKLFLILLIILPGLTYAFSWNDLWFNDNQQGQHLLKQNKAKAAAAKFKDDKWKGIAYYKDKQFDQAYNEFKKDKSGLGYYNQGNALAQSQKYQEAIDAYTQALKIDRNNADAKYNIELLKKLQQQQKNKDNSESKPQDNEQKDNKDQSKSDKSKDNKQKDSEKKDQQSKDNDQSKSDQSKDDKQKDSTKDNQQSQSNDAKNKPDNQAKPNQSEADKQKDSSNQNKPENKDKNQADKVNQATEDPKKDNKDLKDALAGNNMTPEEKRRQQQLKAALSQIPDDPGGLLRNKFRRDYQNEQQQGNSQ